MTATRVDVVEPSAGALERVRGHGVDQLEVVARGDLRHHAAVARVQQPLGGDHVRRDLAVAAHDRGAGVVAARLDGEDHVRRRASRSDRPPHDQRVLVVVVVVAAAQPGGAEAEALVQADRAVVRGPHLERVLLARACRPARTAGRAARVAMPWRRRAVVHGHVHQVPDRVVARADQVARPSRRPRARPGRCRTASRARARTSRATTASGTRAARSRSPAAGRRR